MTTPLLLVVFAMFLLTFALGCDHQDDSPDDLPDTWLSDMLRTVPAQTYLPTHLSYLWIANYEGGRVPLPMGYPEDIVPYGMHWGTIGAPPGEYWNSRPLIMDAIGLDFFYRDQSVWIYEDFFGVHTGELGDPAQIYGRLLDAGYDRYHHRGVEYYRLATSLGSAEKKNPQYGTSLYFLVNSISFLDNRTLVTARHPRDLKRIIDAREGLVRSMWDEERWRTLAKATGDEILGGLLIAPEYVMSPFETEDGAITELRYWAGDLKDWSRYAEGPDAWGTLEPYTASAIGYTVRDGAAGTLIALYHPDPEAADRNAVELKHRWKTAHMDLRGEPTGLNAAQAHMRGEDIPFTEMCAPLETRTLVFDESSVLLANCTAIEREAILSGAGGYDFYWGVFNYDELHFLVPDLSGLASE